MSTLKIYNQQERAVVSKPINLEIEILRSLKEDLLFEFGLPIRTRGSFLQKEIAQAAINLAERGEVHLQKRDNGEYLVSLDTPDQVNQRIAEDYKRYHGLKKYDKKGIRYEPTPPRHSRLPKQAEMAEQPF
tara:strand:+ start:2786 stop:3178 length:393 start_codon:yes stop_codon:yes gene_type:complete